MKTALVSAKGAERFYADEIFDKIEKMLHRELIFLMEDMEWMPNLGLLTIAGVADADDDLTYIDEEYLSKDTMEELLYKRDFDLVCMSVINAQYKRSCEIAEIYRKRGIPVLMGGIHPTALPDETLQHCNFIITGEAEEAFPRFLKDFKAGKPERIYSGSKPVDLTKIPPPRFDLMKQFDYHKKFNRFPIQATRGCPRQCDFCFLPRIYGPVHRHKTIEQVINEIRTVKKIVEQPFISFTDENMFIDNDYAEKLVAEIAKEKVLWECYCDISVAKQHRLLSLLSESHCTLLLIGFETLDPDNLQGTTPWKQEQIKNYRESIKKIQSFGMGISGLFIVGFDNDDPSVFNGIRDFVLETGLVDTEVSTLCPFPGTKLYDRMDKEGRMLTRDWSKYTWIHTNFQPMRITRDQILQGLFRLFKDFTGIDRLIMQKRYFRQKAKRLYGEGIHGGDKPTFLSQ